MGRQDALPYLAEAASRLVLNRMFPAVDLLTGAFTIRLMRARPGLAREGWA